MSSRNSGRPARGRGAMSPREAPCPERLSPWFHVSGSGFLIPERSGRRRLHNLGQFKPWLGLWTSVSQGGNTPGAPITAVLSAPNRITLFLSDPEGGIYTASGFGDQWGSWTSVSDGASTPGAPITSALRGSCPVAWCSWRGLIATISGVGRIGQMAMAGNPTMGSSLNEAMVSRVM